MQKFVVVSSSYPSSCRMGSNLVSRSRRRPIPTAVGSTSGTTTSSVRFPSATVRPNLSSILSSSSAAAAIQYNDIYRFYRSSGSQGGKRTNTDVSPTGSAIVGSQEQEQQQQQKRHPPPAAGSIYRPPDSFFRINNNSIHNDEDDDKEGNDGDYLFLPHNDPVLKQCIRSCIKEDLSMGYYYDDDDRNEYTKPKRAATTADAAAAAAAHSDYHKFDTEMSVCFLGTGAGQPSRHRSTTATLLRLGGAAYLFDAGEGVQRQLQFTMSGKLSLVRKIFITHLHGDHIFGLPGLILGIQGSMINTENNAMNNSNFKRRYNKNGNNNNSNNHDSVDDNDDETVVKLYGPPGLFHYVASAVIMSCTRLHSLSIEVHELVGGRVRRATTPPRTSGEGGGNNDNNILRNPFTDEYPEYTYGGRLRRIKVPCRNGVWTLEDYPPLTRDDITQQTRRPSGGSSRRAVNHRRPKRMQIQAAEVDHLPGIATFGYVIEEAEPPRNIDAAKARQLGVRPEQNKYELLKFGFPVEADDAGDGNTGTGSPVIVYPHQVLKPPSKKARKIAIIGDNREWTPQMIKIAQNATVLVHEATLQDEDYTRGHSTPAMAGLKSNACNAELLVLNHISPRSEEALSELVEKAYGASKEQSSVLVSFDFLELVVPWMGFRQRQIDQSYDDTSGCGNDHQSLPFTNGRISSDESGIKQWVRGLFHSHSSSP